MPSKERLSPPNINEQKEKNKPVYLERVWNGVNYRAEFTKLSPTKLLLTLTGRRKTQQFEVSNVRNSKDLYEVLHKAFEHMFPDESFPPPDHPKFSFKIKTTFESLYPQRSMTVGAKLPPKEERLPFEEINWETWEEPEASQDDRENIDIKWSRNKYIIEWDYNGKSQRISLLWRESKFGEKSFVMIYHKSRWALRGAREHVLLTDNFDSFWYNFGKVLEQWNLKMPENLKEEIKHKLWEKILYAKLKKVSINSDKAEVVFKRWQTNYVVRLQNKLTKAIIFINNRKITDINFDKWINGFAIELGKVLNENIGIPRQNAREVVLAIWDSWKLKYSSYNPEFVSNTSFGDPSIFDSLKKMFPLTNEDLQKFKINFLRFNDSIEKDEADLENAFKGIMEYLYYAYSDKFNSKGIKFEDLMDNFTLIYNNLKISLYYFAHLESDFKNVKYNSKSSAKWYFQILTDNGVWEDGEWAPSSFQVAVNRLYQAMSFLKETDKQAYNSIKALIGDEIYDILMNTSRASEFPSNVNNKLLEISPGWQGILAFINFLTKVSNKNFDMLLDILRWRPDAILEWYLLYHHTNADAQTINRAKDLSMFYFPFLKEFDFR